MRAQSNPIDTRLAQKIRLVIFDVDGVLTDAGLYVGEASDGSAVELKRFDIQDGVGIKMLAWGGLDVAIVSGRVSQATALRARELGVTECHQEPDGHKLRVVQNLLHRKGLNWDEVAMMGDDIPDLAVMRLVALRAAVGNATAPIVAVANWQATRSGGHGAAREFCDALLEARGVLSEIIEGYVEERSVT